MYGRKSNLKPFGSINFRPNTGVIVWVKALRRKVAYLLFVKRLLAFESTSHDTFHDSKLPLHWEKEISILRYSSMNPPFIKIM
jgi:hypothetical protein